MKYNHPLLAEADQHAKDGNSAEMYKALAMLNLADYCELFLSRPREFEHLNRVLPSMPADDTQRKWVGDSGRSLMVRSCNLARLFDLISMRLTGKSLSGKRILDYGCGWGRLTRLMNFYSPAERVIGLDPMQSSLEHCMENGLKNPLELIDTRPETLPLELCSIDFAFSFSVFTHTPKEVTEKVFETLHQYMSPNSVFVATIRTIEWVSVRDGVWTEELTDSMRQDYNIGEYGFVPVNSGDSLSTMDYGDTIMTPQFLMGLAEKHGWRGRLVERDLSEPFQIAVAFTPN
jgi:SAM-dependent methyltransferase